jgi:hypothetical protein
MVLRDQILASVFSAVRGVGVWGDCVVVCWDGVLVPLFVFFVSFFGLVCLFVKHPLYLFLLINNIQFAF